MNCKADRNAALVARYLAGEKPSALSVAFGVSRKHVHFILAMAGVEAKPRGRKRLPLSVADRRTYHKVRNLFGAAEARKVFNLEAA